MKKIIFLLISGISFGQVSKLYNGDKYNMVMKSPDASQISKHIDIPTTSFTGTKSFEIPIYTIKENNIVLPISLKYHCSGIKVNEVASRAGLGWVISFGDISLSRQIIGVQDDGSAIQVDFDNFNPNYNDIDNNKAGYITGFNAIYGDDSFAKHDSQPDIFSYSFPGGSGQFFYDSAGKIIRIPQDDNKISGNFVVTDKQGNTYYFSSSNNILSSPLRSHNKYSNTDYKIDKIEFTNGKSILFEYESVTYKYLSNYNKSVTKTLNGTCPDKQEEGASYHNVLWEKILKRILFDQGTIDISYSNREDIEGDKKIDKITVKDKNNKIITDFSFNHSYFIPDTYTTTLNSDYENTLKLSKRLKLNSIKNNLDNSTYIFEYNEQYPLPNRFSFATDYLGYYNGKHANRGIPIVLEGNQNVGLDDDKRPDIEYAVSGSLKNIIFPTGGKTAIDYENDEFLYDDYEEFITKKSTVINNGDPVQQINISSDANQIHFIFDFQSTANPIDDGTGSLPIENYFIGELLNMNNQVIKTFLINKEYSFLIDKAPSYKIKIRSIGNTVNHAAHLYVNWYEIQRPYIKYNKKIGGLRVRQISLYDSDGNIKIKQKYKYTDNNGFSTGKYIGDPLYYKYRQEYPADIILGTSCEEIVVSNAGNINISSVNGKPIAYNAVETIFENVADNSKSYKTSEYYDNFDITNINTFDTPLFTYANNGFRRGILKKKEVYDNNNNIVEKTENEYSYDNHFNLLSNDYKYLNTPSAPVFLYIKKVVPEVMSGGSISSYRAFYGLKKYEITSSWVKPTKTKTTKYFNGISMQEITDYYYDNSYRHLNPISQTNTSPDGSITQTTYQYAHEKNNQKLINANMIGIPLETSVLKKQNASDTGKTISRTETKYDNPAHLFSTSVLSYDLQNTASTEVTYDQYDGKGNLQQYTTKDGIPTAIIWGYNQTQPIAKIVGATYAQVSTLAAAIISASNLDASNPSNEAALITALDNFRKDSTMAGYQISTYTYDPLIGVTTITPPSGIREVYLYDTANRLKEIRENSATGKLLKEFKYNYKN